MLVCGPTNKSVIVLARKVLSDMAGEESMHLALIGDQSELLADNEEELEPWLVYTTIWHWRKSWKRLQHHLLKTSDFNYFMTQANDLLAGMHRRLSVTRKLEEPVSRIADIG